MKITPLVLENAVVRLEPLTEPHREALRPLAQEAELWALTSLRGDGAHFDDWFALMLSGTQAGTQISHLVRDARTGAPLGHSAFLAIVPEHARLEIGWTWYGPAARGTAVNPAAKRLLLGRAFESGAERVELKTHHRNLRSQRAMEKMGATREGTLRRHIRCWTGEWRDTVWYSVLRGEWPAVRDGLERRIAGTQR